MTSRVSQDIDLRQGFVRSLEERREPGAAEGYERVQEMLGRAESWNGAIRLERLKPAVDFIAELHPRAAGHSLVPEIRFRARDHGVPFFLSNLRDAVAAPGALRNYAPDAPHEFPAARARLQDGLQRLLDDAPRRVRLMEEHGGLDPILHGDLWPKNIFVSMTAAAPDPRLIDWDHVGAGPFSYDVSTLLYQSSPSERPWMLRRYREARSEERRVG